MPLRVLLIMSTALVVLSAAELPGTTPPPGYELRWADDFNSGALDLNTWMYRTGPRLQSYNRPENVFVEDGNAVIVMKQEPYEGMDHTSGGLITKRKFRYAYYEARVKMFGGAGWHQSVWAMNADTGSRGSLSTEIDGIEFDSDDPLRAHTGVILWRRDGKNTHLTCSPGVYRRPLGFNTTTGYHTYGFEWTEQDVRIFLDGQLNCVLPHPYTEHRHDPLNFWLTSVAHVKLAGEIDDSKLPGRMHIDHASVYEKDIYIDDGDPQYTEQGDWIETKAGFSFSTARQSCAKDASASWQPDVLVSDNYQVFLYRVPPSGKAGEAAVKIDAADGPRNKTVQFTKAPAAWVDLGTYRFEAGKPGSVTITTNRGCAVADMVKFVRQPPAASGSKPGD